MKTVAIVGGGPADCLPDLQAYRAKADYWIGADRGAVTLLHHQIKTDLAIGDFDSVSSNEFTRIRQTVDRVEVFPAAKDETDLELALLEALKQNPDEVIFFGVTGGRLDHTLANIQLLLSLKQEKVNGIIIDRSSQLQIVRPGVYEAAEEPEYPYISFLPVSPEVTGLSLSEFLYPLENAVITWGSTRCISNKLLSGSAVFSFKTGIMAVIRSRDETDP